MAAYRRKTKQPQLSRLILWTGLGLLVAVLIGVAVAWRTYYNELKPVSNNPTTQIFTVKPGSTVKGIAGDLQKAKLIKSSWALQVYVYQKNLTAKLQAGTYAISPNQGTADIIKIMTKGRVTVSLVTIIPGKRIDQVRADLINAGFTPAAVDQSLDPKQYADLPVLAHKPADINSLEGLLWPESWQKDATTGPEYIIRQSLTQMGEQLTPDVQAGFAAQGLSLYRGLILASIVMQEVDNQADQAQAAQVFLSRLKADMALDSDASVKYGAVAAGLAPTLTYDSAYNTYKHKGLPPTPISTTNLTSLHAVARPAGTNWLYFVSGDDGKTYFSTNLQDHQALTKKHCTKLCNN